MASVDPNSVNATINTVGDTVNKLLTPFLTTLPPTVAKVQALLDSLKAAADSGKLLADAGTAWLKAPVLTLSGGGGGTPPPPGNDDTVVLSIANYAPPDLSSLAWFPTSTPNWFAMDVSTLPVHPNSAAVMATVGSAKPHSDFNANAGDGFLPMLVDASTPKVTVTWLANDNKSASPGASQSDPGPYPIPTTGIYQEHGAVRDDPNFQDDHHVLLVDVAGKKLYELYQLRHLADKGWVAYSGAVFDLTKPLPQRPAGWTSADAAGLPMTPFLIFKAEVDAAVADGSFTLKHPLRCTLGSSANRYAFQSPATHAAGNVGTANVASRAPFGSLLRMKASADISALKAASPTAYVILNTFKKRGAYVADNGSDGFVFYSGTYSPLWNDDDLIRTTGFLASANFELVDDGQAIVPQT